MKKDNEERARATKPKDQPWKFVPPDWNPKESHRELANRLGVNLEQQAQLFRLHEFKTPKTDADRAFAGWLHRQATFGQSGKSNGYVPQGAPDGYDAGALARDLCAE